MEALLSLGINWRALVSQVVNFLILLVLLRIFLYRPILGLLEQRKAKIKRGLEDSEKAKEELEKAEDKSKSIIRQANRRAQDIVDATQKQAKEEMSKATDEAKLKSQKIIESAKNQAEVEKVKVISQAKAQVGEMVIMATQKIIGDKSEADSIDKIINSINE